ncbi:response regulator transcription factor [Thermoflexibacter ruber]|uniref:DNA-binding response regulator, NarL/FixJ family, contains REC and HTH domains n=1 Tax=Thermoflexibacter ruber TaxID=1003 RepID=A0A1I2BHQ2_9BACT|nr:response regulator transcription factor [Thermoflexibacter ruber]SFE55704.1 DNA-binding response regulator, NarL/FixJ family, contains REC and HTH domains [Thermoflexibacter ruber]
MKIKVLLIDDHHLVRKGIRLLLEDVEDIEVIGEASNGKEGLEKIKMLQPDLALVDISMPEMNGIEMVGEAKKQFPQVKSLILSMHNSEEYILQSLDAGAYGYMLKDSTQEEMLRAIREVNRGERFFSNAVANLIVNAYMNLNKQVQHQNDKKKTILSDREKEIIALLIEGLNSKEIAEKLDLSVRTVDNHRANIIKRLQVRNTAELVKIAMEEKLVE